MHRKIILVLVAVFVTANLAQAQFSLGARAGFNLTNMSMKFDGEKADPKPDFKPGFQVGVVGEYAFGSLALQPAILFATQGYKMGEGDYKVTTNLNYLQVPINVQYKYGLGGVSLLGQAGPYLGYAFSGKAKMGDESSDIEFGSEDNEMKAFDFGVGLGLGVEFLSKMQATVGYNIGLANLANADKVTTKNNGLAITFTYMFLKK
jgi:hypothetical protein